MVIAVDSGKHATKAIDAQKNTFTIKTQIDESSIMGDGVQVEYNGKNYVVGDGATDYDILKSKLCHKLCTYVALAQLSHGMDVDLVIGTPITHFVNKQAREEHAEYFKGRVQIRVNGMPYCFSVNSVMTLPETLGVVMQNPNEYLNSIVGVIDVGSLNVNAAVYDRLRPVKASVFAMNEGCNIVNANIKRALNTTFLTNFQDYEIPHLQDTKARTVIDEVLNAQMNRIIEECKKYNWNVSALPVIFTGGGSLLLEKQIRAHNWSISRDPIWDNAKGFLKYKEMTK